MSGDRRNHHGRREPARAADEGLPGAQPSEMILRSEQKIGGTAHEAGSAHSCRACDAADCRRQRRAGADLGRRGQDRRAHRHEQPVFRRDRAGLAHRRADGGAGFRRQGEGQAGRGDRRRSPEQAGRRREHCPPMVRHRAGRRDRRRTDVIDRARRAGDHPRQEQGLPDVGARRL